MFCQKCEALDRQHKHKNTVSFNPGAYAVKLKKLKDSFLYFTAFRQTASQCDGFVVVATFSKTENSLVCVTVVPRIIPVKKSAK